MSRRIKCSVVSTEIYLKCGTVEEQILIFVLQFCDLKVMAGISYNSNVSRHDSRYLYPWRHR